MAQKNYKVGEQIKVLYQAAGAASGINVQMDVYDETGTLDSGQSGLMTEVGTTGRYYKTFTPDERGEWQVLIADANGGKAIKLYSIGDYHVDSVGALVATVDAKVDAADDKIEAVDTLVTVVDGKVDILGGKVDALQADVDDIQQTVGGLESPPMIC